MTIETILSDEQIIAIGKQARAIEPGENGYILPVKFARAIEQAVLQSNAEAIRALLAERDTLREALEIGRDFVAEALAQERDAYRGHESVSSIADIERYLAQIDAAMEKQQ